MDDGEDDEVLGLHLAGVALVGDGEHTSGDISPGGSVHVYRKSQLVG